MTLAEEEPGIKKSSNSIDEDDEERNMRKKRTLQAIKSGSTKYMLPTLTKINRDENIAKSRTELDQPRN